MPYIVELNSAAQRDYSNLEHSTSTRVSEVVDTLADNPRPPGCVKLTGKGREYRVRVGAYRVIYTIDDRMRLVSVKRIQHRREAYR
jgi:mRNA interferase RelE/StbE